MSASLRMVRARDVQADGHVYIGEWKNGQKEGLGTETSADGGGME